MMGFFDYRLKNKHGYDKILISLEEKRMYPFGL